MIPEVDRIRLAAGRASQVAGLIASKSREPEELVRVGIEAARAALGCDMVVVALGDPAGSTLSVFDSTDPALRGMRVASNELAGAIMQWNRGEVVPDVASDPRRGALSAAAGMRRFVCTPVRVKHAPRGSILAGWRAPGAGPADAGDLIVLGLFADLIAIALAELEELRTTRSFHERLSQLAARSFDRWLGDELDPALNAVAREAGLELEGAGCDPILPEIGRVVRAEAAVIGAPDLEGRWRVADSWGLRPATARDWTESGDDVRRVHRDGRFSCVTTATGFAPFDQDLRVLLRAPDGARVLHLLARSSRGPFGPADLRCAEMAAVRLGWSLHATAMEVGKPIGAPASAPASAPAPAPDTSDSDPFAAMSFVLEISETALEPIESAV